MVSASGRSSIRARILGIMVLGVILLPSLLMLVPAPVAAWSPPANTWVWSAASASNANNAANWNPASVPSSGANILFNATSAYSCSWDLTGSYNNFTMDLGYTGTVTLSNVVTVGNLSVNRGVFAGNYKTLTAFGNVSHFGGSVSAYMLKMIGSNTDLTCNCSGGLGLYNLSIYADVDMRVYNTTNGLNAVQWYIHDGSTLTLAPSISRTFTYRAVPGYAGASWVNRGTIQGTNNSATYVVFDMRGDTTVVPGDVACSMVFKVPSTATSDRVATIGGTIDTEGSVEVISEHTSYALTVDVSSYNLTSSGFYLGPRTTFNAEDCTVTVAGVFDTDDGSLNTEDCQLVLAPQTSSSFVRDGIWCWFADPRGIFHDGVTYYSYTNRAGSVFIAAYDHETRIQTIHELDDRTVYDDHGNPAILIRPDGRILVTWGGHVDNELWVTVSNTPGDISAWSEPQNIAAPSELVSYPSLCYLSSESKVYLLSRNGSSQDGDWCYRTSSDLGGSWSEPVTMLDYGSASVYIKFATDSADTIYFAASQSESNTHANVAAFYYEDDSFWKPDGTEICTTATLPMSESDLDMVFNSTTEGYPAWIWDVAVEGGDIAVVYAIFEEPSSEHTYEYARWSDGAWTCTELVGGGNMTAGASYHYSGGIYLDHSDIDTLYLSTKRLGDWLQIERWTTETEGATWSYTAITQDSGCKNVRPFVVWNHSDELEVMWVAGGYDAWPNALFDTNLHAIGEAGAIYVVPSSIDVADHSTSVTADGLLDVYAGDCALRVVAAAGVEYSLNVGALSSSHATWAVSDIGTNQVTFTVDGLGADTGYRIYQDGELKMEQEAGSAVLIFTTTGGGEFEVVTWTLTPDATPPDPVPAEVVPPANEVAETNISYTGIGFIAVACASVALALLLLLRRSRGPSRRSRS